MSDSSCLALHDIPLQKYACHELKTEDHLTGEKVCSLLCPHQPREDCVVAYDSIALDHRNLCRTQWQTIHTTATISARRANAPHVDMAGNSHMKQPPMV